MGWSDLIVGSHALHNIIKAYVNAINAIPPFVEPTPPTNIITNETILAQYIIKQVINVFEKKSRLNYKSDCRSFTTAELLIQRSLNTSDEQLRNSLA